MGREDGGGGTYYDLRLLTIPSSEGRAHLIEDLLTGYMGDPEPDPTTPRWDTLLEDLEDTRQDLTTTPDPIEWLDPTLTIEL